MPGLQIVGRLASQPTTPAPDEITQGFESYGIFVVGDVRAAAEYSGTNLGSRWLCRIQGPLLDRVKNWPTPNNEVWRYHPSEEAARGMYQQLRSHAATAAPGVRFVDTRANNPLNAPSALAESIYQGDDEIARLIMDRMTDQQVAIRQTNCIRKFAAHPAQPDGAQMSNYVTSTEFPLRVAIAPGPSGAAEHLCLIFSMEQAPEPWIMQGMPRAVEKINHTTKPFTFPSNIALAFWGRVAGNDVLAPARGQDPGAAIHAYLQNNIIAPLATNLGDLDHRLGGTPAAYAIRMEPGEYVARYYELDATAQGGHSFLAISRVGAPAFQPAGPGNAGGRVIQGLTMDRYAMLSAERDTILMQQGQNAGPALNALCQRYGIAPSPVTPMMSARITEWDVLIQGDAKLTAQWLAQMTVARMKLSGQEVTQEQLTAISMQSHQQQQQLQQHAQAHADGKKRINQAAIAILEAARTASKEMLVDQAKKANPNKPSDVLYEAVRILKNPDTKDSPRYGAVDLFAEKVVQAHYASMSPEDQKFEGKEKSYVKDQIATIYEKNGLPVPGAGGFLSRLMDKL